MKLLLNIVICCLILASCSGRERSTKSGGPDGEDGIEQIDEVEIADDFIPDELPDNMPKMKTAGIKVSLPPINE